MSVSGLLCPGAVSMLSGPGCAGSSRLTFSSVAYLGAYYFTWSLVLRSYRLLLWAGSSFLFACTLNRGFLGPASLPHSEISNESALKQGVGQEWIHLWPWSPTPPCNHFFLMTCRLLRGLLRKQRAGPSTLGGHMP